MKLLMENWRKYLTEDGTTDSGRKNGHHSRDTRPHIRFDGYANSADPESGTRGRLAEEDDEPVLGRTEIEDIITDKFSFNSLQGPDHRFTPGQPVVDYDFDEQRNEWKFIAWVSSDPKKAKETPDFEIEEGETLEAFLTRVKESPRQPNLGLE